MIQFTHPDKNLCKSIIIKFSSILNLALFCRVRCPKGPGIYYAIMGKADMMYTGVCSAYYGYVCTVFIFSVV